jgi:diguanylate cyclase (GGDEF)-like protein
MICGQSWTGIAILCDERGIIQKVIRNDFGFEELMPGKPLGHFVDSNSRIKLLNFLVELRGKNSAFDWEINIPKEEQFVTLHLAGVIVPEGLMIVGAPTSHDALSWLDEWMKINSSANNDLQTILNDQIHPAGFQTAGNLTYYDEFSRLNNELITLQRVLAKKNIELELLYEEVKKQAITDLLTGVYNRRGFFELSDREIARSKRYRHPLALIMFDLDDFKIINDTHGHAFGDHVLIEIAKRCSRELRKVDIIGRFGGDEFLVLLPDTQLTDARSLAERLCQISNLPIEVGQEKLTISISIGVTIMTDKNADIHELLKCADSALYKAKASGRNCVFIDQS